MASFPFLLIPQLCQLEILKELPSDDIVVLSLTSTRVRKLVKLCKWEVDSTWNLEDNKLVLTMSFGDCDFVQVTMNHCDQDAWNSLLLSFLTQERDREDLSFWSISNFSVFGQRSLDVCDRSSENEPNITLYTRNMPSSTTSRQMTCTILDYLQDAFLFETNNVLIYGLKNAHGLNHLLHLTGVWSVAINAKFVQDASIVKYFLDIPNVTELKITSVVKEPFYYNRTLSMEEIEIYNASWMGINCLMNMSCMTVTLSGHQFTSEDINAFLKHWKQEGSNKLVCLELCNGTKTFDMEIVMSGVSAFSRVTRVNPVLDPPNLLFKARVEGVHGMFATVTWAPPVFQLKRNP